MQESFAVGKAQGFNLMELMVTLAIAGILAALAFPSFRSIIGDSQMSSTTNDFVSSIHTARSEAVKRGGRAGLCPSADPLKADAVCSDSAAWAAGWIAFVDVNEDGDRDNPSDELLVQMEARTPGFSFSVVKNVYKDLIYFSSDGGSITKDADPVSGTINLKYGDEEERNITVSANGRVSTEVVKH